MAGRRAALTDVFVHGDRYSLVAAITTEGYMAAHAVEGSFDSESFMSLLQQKWCMFFLAFLLLPYMNPFPAERSVLVLDNCRIHHNE
ncbi:hypothetical protein BDR07DRAFT_1319566, partial [Suillus spraguei]